MDNLVVNAVAPWQGYLHWVGNIREGKSRNGNDYSFCDFTLKYSDHKLQEKYITFTSSTVESVSLLKGLQIGTPLKVGWMPDTQEDTQRDRWYPSFKAYNVSVIKDVATPASTKPEKITAPNFPAQGTSMPSGAPKYKEIPPDEGWKNPMKAQSSDYEPDEDNLPF